MSRNEKEIVDKSTQSERKCQQMTKKMKQVNTHQKKMSANQQNEKKKTCRRIENENDNKLMKKNISTRVKKTRRRKCVKETDHKNKRERKLQKKIKCHFL